MKNILTAEEITRKLEKIDGWTWSEDKLKKTFAFQDFRRAMSFIVRISYEAEQRDHHPEIFNCYNRVELCLNTHDAGGKVTEKDFDLASTIDRVSDL